MNTALGYFACVTGLLLSGCASIVTGQNQVVSVDAITPTERVVGAHCTLINDKGVYYLSTPGSVTLHRSDADLMVRCEKNGVPIGELAVASHTKGMAFGNIIIGGPIGAAVDIGTGAAYDYPTLITVQMPRPSPFARSVQ